MHLSTDTIDEITGILDTAYAAGRNVLYEYEVYEVLKAAGLHTPAYVLVEGPDKICGSALKPFKDKAVLKVVSPDIAHKQKIGGVKIIKELSAESVKNSIADMEREIYSHFISDEKPELKGYLLVEFIPFDQSLGNEVLFGMKHDEAFGPVLTLSKGGDDAEFFAKYYDPANLIMPPLDDAEALLAVNSLNIKHKFETIGHMEYINYIAGAASVLSWLAYTFSCIAGQNVKYAIQEMDINPFVISQDQRFIAVDGFAKFAPCDPSKQFASRLRPENISTFFKPNGIAIVGVSADPAKKSTAKEIACLMHRMGRRDIYLINKNGGAIIIDGMEYPLYKSIGEINAKIELAVYAAPAQFIMDFISELSQKHIKNLILISGIPSNVKYTDFKASLDQTVSKDLRIIGPNCMGVYYGKDSRNTGVNTLFISDKKLEIKSNEKSNTAMITQSGALGVTMLDRLGNSQIFKSVVSFGNKYDVNVNDLLQYFADDKNIEVIALYLEGLEKGEGRRFFEVAKTIRKPIIVFKSGKTEAGAMAASSHTASMSCSYEVFQAACLQAGLILAEKIEDQMDYIKIFSLLAHKLPRGARVAGVFNAGFETTISADELNHLIQSELSQNTFAKLKKADRLGLLSGASSFLDITPGADDKMYGDFTEALLQDDDVDCVVVAIVPHANDIKSDPETCRDAGSLANRLIGLSGQYEKPLIISVNGGRYYQDFIAVMEEEGLPVFSDVRSAINSLDRFVTYYMRPGVR